MRTTLATRAAFLLTAGFWLSADMNNSRPTAPSITAPDYDPAAVYQQGMKDLKAHRYAEAKKAFMEVYSAAPRDPNVNLVLGVSMMGLNDFKGAQRYLELAVKLNPKMVVAHEQLGIAYAKLGQKDKAQAELSALKQLQAKCGGTCSDADKLNTAITSVTTALGQPQAMITGPGELLFASTQSGDTAYLEAVRLINEHRYQDALVSLEKARAVFGAHPDILTYIGFANRKLGRFDVARNYYLQALAVAPQHKGATEYYGELLVERGNMAGAKAILARLDKICTFGCAEADELRLWIKDGHAPQS
jgi:tetratricopeptide (TPR) repeat protein